MTFRMPAEWAPHDWTWIGFPTNPDEWPDAFDAARGQIAAFANALRAGGKVPAKFADADPDDEAIPLILKGHELSHVGSLGHIAHELGRSVAARKRAR